MHRIPAHQRLPQILRKRRHGESRRQRPQRGDWQLRHETERPQVPVVPGGGEQGCVGRVQGMGSTEDDAGPHRDLGTGAEDHFRTHWMGRLQGPLRPPADWQGGRRHANRRRPGAETGGLDRLGLEADSRDFDQTLGLRGRAGQARLARLREHAQARPAHRRAPGPKRWICRRKPYDGQERGFCFRPGHPPVRRRWDRDLPGRRQEGEEDAADRLPEGREGGRPPPQHLHQDRRRFRLLPFGHSTTQRLLADQRRDDLRGEGRDDLEPEDRLRGGGEVPDRREGPGREDERGESGRRRRVPARVERGPPRRGGLRGDEQRPPQGVQDEGGPSLRAPLRQMPLRVREA
mmetsp:Transcript_15000/g.36729  ORF Transcript_15000/g.36729 Transcript_15000/m.36729 type:complete len:347 (+) Transcript_15000:490-1530(+)